MGGRTSKSWTPAHRKAQSEAVHRWRLWESSTGPKTEAGKRASAMRSLKSGVRSASVKQAASLAFAVSKLTRELDE